MTSTKMEWSRRRFLKTAGAAGIGVATLPHLAASAALAADASPEDELDRIPTRVFGRTGKALPVLSLGGMFDIPHNQIILQLASRWGVTCWDTAHVYGGGISEKGIGLYLKRTPTHRKKLFLVTKSTSRDVQTMEQQFNESLRRLQTDYVDAYFLHDVASVSEISDDIRRWVDTKKEEGKINYFGFSTHKNMSTCLRDAAKTDSVDGVMMSYNFRLMQQPEMNDAVHACHEAGIGLIAMKTQGGGSVKSETETEAAMAGRFVEQGFTDKQAKLKAVWEDKRITSICSQMPNSTILMANIAAAMDKKTLSVKDRGLMAAYAIETGAEYCAGCSDICSEAVNGEVPVSDVMRFLMYAHSYDDVGLAREHYRALSERTRNRIATVDYSAAEHRCPQKMAIGRLMKAAVIELA